MYRKKSNGWFKHFDFIIIDLLCVQFSYVLAYFFRHGLTNLYEVELYRNMALMIEIADLIVIFMLEQYKGVLRRGYYNEFVSVLKQMIFIELISSMYLFTIKSGGFSRVVLYLMGAFYLELSYITRVLWKNHLKKKMEEGGKRSLLIVTTRASAEDVIKNVRAENYDMFNISGLVISDSDMTGRTIGGVKVVANMQNVSKYILKNWVDEVFINMESGTEYPQELVDDLVEMGVVVHFNLYNIENVAGNRHAVERLGNYTVLTSSMNYATNKQAFAKRTMDIAGGIVGCIFTGIIFIFIAPVIYISSPGPIFFSQTRVGQNGKRFKIYKFRSMYMDAEERKKELMAQNRVKDGMMFKMDFDPRIIGNKILPDGTKKTGIGHFIRVTSLDEFPQFFNVLKGDMSLVGTRPPTEDEVEKYDLHHRARLATKPGITGMWQVSGRSKITDFEEIVRLDTEYIEKWSIGLDIKILVKTVGVLFRKDGAM